MAYQHSTSPTAGKLKPDRKMRQICGYDPQEVYLQAVGEYRRIPSDL